MNRFIRIVNRFT